MHELLNIAGRVFGVVLAFAGVVLHDYLRYRQGHASRKHKRPLLRLTPAQRRARYLARRQRTRPYTGKTQRLDPTPAEMERTGRRS